MKPEPIKSTSTGDDLREIVRAQLDGTDAGKANLAHRLGIGEAALSTMLRSRQSIGPGVAAALGYRRVIRYERAEVSDRPRRPLPLDE